MTGTAQKIGSAMVWSVLARTGRFALGMVSSVIVVRSLGDHDYGVLSLIRTLLMFVVIVAGAGLGQAVLKFLPVLRVEKSSAEATRLVRRILVFHAISWVVLAVTVYLARGWIASMFQYEGFGTLIAAAVALVVFELFYAILTQILNSNFDTRMLSLATIAGHVTYIVGLLVVLPRGGGVLGVLLATAAGQLVSSVMLLGRLRPAVTFAGEDRGVALGTRRLAKYSIPFALIGVLNLVVWRQSETIFLAYFRSAAETGYFDLAYRMAQLILEFIPGVIWPLVMAGVSESYARNNKSLRTAIDRYYRMLFILCAPVCIAGIVLGGRMISIVFGPEMAPAAIPTQVFFAIFTVSFFGTPLSMALYVMEKTHINLVIYLFLAVLNVALDLLLIPRYGVIGAMVPVAIVILISPVIYRVVLGRFIDGVTIPVRFIGKCFMASSPLLLLIPLLRFVDGVVELVVVSILAVVIVVVSYKMARVLGKDERDMLGTIPIPMADRLLKFMSS